MTDDFDLMDPKELSRLTNIPVHTITRLASEGKIPASKIGRQWRFIRQDIETWLRTTASNRKFRVLVADDEPQILRSIGRVLSRAGHEVTMATGGEEAMTVLRQDRRFSLLILDLMMPKVSGPDVMEWMKKQDIKILTMVVTAYAESELMDRMMTYGHFTILKKPFNPDELITNVDRLLMGVAHEAFEE